MITGYHIRHVYDSLTDIVHETKHLYITTGEHKDPSNNMRSAYSVSPVNPGEPEEFILVADKVNVDPTPVTKEQAIQFVMYGTIPGRN